MANPVDYEPTQPRAKPRTRWWLLILLLILVPVIALGFSIVLIAMGYLGPGD